MGGSEAARLNIKNKGQTVIMLCGLQGNGKTTHAAKLAKFYIKQAAAPCWWLAISTALRLLTSCRWWASRPVHRCSPCPAQSAGDRP